VLIRLRNIWIAGMLSIGVIGIVSAQRTRPDVAHTGRAEQPPVFELDSSWPKPLPHNWALGVVWAVAVDSHHHVFALHAPARYLDDIARYVGKSASEWISTHENKVFILRRSDLQVLGSFESVGNHYLAIDHNGNVIACGTSETGRTRLPQRFLLKHMPKHGG
jgi:hypothetical protein